MAGSGCGEASAVTRANGSRWRWRINRGLHVAPHHVMYGLLVWYF